MGQACVGTAQARGVIAVGDLSTVRALEIQTLELKHEQGKNNETAAPVDNIISDETGQFDCALRPGARHVCVCK